MCILKPSNVTSDFFLGLYTQVRVNVDDMLYRSNTITESAGCLYCIRVRVHHGVFRKVAVGQHDYVWLFVQLNIYRIVKARGQPIVTLNVLHVPIFICLLELYIFIVLQLLHAVSRTEHSGIFEQAKLLHKIINHVRAVTEYKDVTFQ